MNGPPAFRAKSGMTGPEALIRWELSPLPPEGDRGL